MLSLANAVSEVSRELTGADFIGGHAVDGDLKWLRAIGVEQLDGHAVWEDRLVDTQLLAMQQASLRSLADRYGLHPAALHNGGNDAAFTLQVMLSQCGVPFEPPVRTPSTHMAQVP